MRVAMRDKENDGFILLISLLFLAGLTLLAFVILEIGILASKMSSAYCDKIKSFYLAEIELIKKEQSADIRIPGVEIIADNFYRITATGKFKKAKTILQSVVKISAKDNSNSGIKPKRQSFVVLF